MLNSNLINTDDEQLKQNLVDMSDYDNLDLSVEKINYKHDRDIIISLLLPTRNRIKYLDNFLQSLFKRTYKLDRIEVVIYMDDDDVSASEFANEDVNITKIVGPKLTMGQYNSVCYRLCSGRIIMLVNDDVVIKTDNWDSLLINQLDKIDDEIYLAYPDDGINRGKFSAFPIMSRKTCETMVYPYPPVYKRLFIDTHIMDVFYRLTAKSEQRIIYLENIKFIHLELNSHFEDAEDYQRLDCHDDYAFITLRELRNSQAARLDSIINGTELPLVEEKYVLNETYKGYLNCCKWFYRNFIKDERLPFILRIKYFVRYGGHFFMIKTICGMFYYRIYGLFKSNEANSVTY